MLLLLLCRVLFPAHLRVENARELPRYPEALEKLT